MITTIKLSAVLFVALYLSQASSELAFLFVVACLFVSFFWRLFIFAARNFFLGFFAGWGARKSGLLKQLQSPRQHAPRQPSDKNTLGDEYDRK
jgi:hypothetical protein